MTRLAAAMRISLLRTVRKPFALPLGISSPHRLAGIRFHWGATSHSPGPGVNAGQSPRIFVLCFDGTGDQFDADVCYYFFLCIS